MSTNLSRLAEAEPAAFDIIDAGRYMGGVGRTTVYELIKAGELPAVKIRGRTVILRDDCDRYLERLRAKAS